MLNKKLDGRLGKLDGKGQKLVRTMQCVKEAIIADFEELNYAAAVRTILACADECNRFFDMAQPWVTIKTDPEATRRTLTAILNAVKILTIYLKPVLPKYAEKIKKILNVQSLSFSDVESVLEEHQINEFTRLVERVEKEKVQAMIDESKQGQEPAAEPEVTLAEPIEAECTIEDFMKVDLRIAKVVHAGPVEGADKLLEMELDLSLIHI